MGALGRRFGSSPSLPPFLFLVFFYLSSDFCFYFFLHEHVSQVVADRPVSPFLEFSLPLSPLLCVYLDFHSTSSGEQSGGCFVGLIPRVMLPFLHFDDRYIYIL